MRMTLAGPAGRFFVAMLAVWALVPFLLIGNLGQDAIPYLAAGDLVSSQPHEVYASRNGDLFDLSPAFATRFCELAPDGTDCENVNVAFVSLPQALPFAALLARAGPTGGVLLMRALASLCLIVGMLALWSELAGASPRAPTMLAATTLLLTPFVMVPLSLGQTSPILFLGAALGVRGTTRPARAAGTAATWTMAIALKAFPLLLGIVLVRQRRWRLLAWSAGALGLLTVIAFVQGPTSLYGDFLRTSVLLGEESAANPYNGAVDALFHAISPALTEGVAARVLLAVRLAAVAGVWWWAARDADDDAQWAFGWLALLLIVPFLWWHYLWVAIAALGIAVARAREPGRWLVALPIAAGLGFPLAILNSRGSSIPVAQALLLLVAVGFTGWLLRTGGEGRTTAAAMVGSSDEG